MKNFIIVVLIVALLVQSMYNAVMFKQMKDTAYDSLAVAGTAIMVAHGWKNACGGRLIDPPPDDSNIIDSDTWINPTVIELK